MQGDVSFSARYFKGLCIGGWKITGTAALSLCAIIFPRIFPIFSQVPYFLLEIYIRPSS